MLITKGLDLPLQGLPSTVVEQGLAVEHVALLGPDYHGMRPTMKVEVGSKVSLGDPLFEDKKKPGALFCAPASGEVKALRRGDKRAFLSCVIAVDGERDAADQKKAFFDEWSLDRIAAASSQEVCERICQAGLWSSLRTRPFSKTPAVDERPRGLFVSTLDTRPLAMDPQVVIARHPEAFEAGLRVLHQGLEREIYLNIGLNQDIPGHDLPFVKLHSWEGKHPAGLVGTHMHILLPVDLQHVNWHIGYQDVIAVGYLFLEGRHWVQRFVALSGSCAHRPRIIQTRLGASLTELTQGEIKQPDAGRVRIISGSVLGGRHGQAPLDFLSRWSQQVCMIPEGDQRDFFLTKGWLSPGFHKFSILGTYLGKFIPGYRFNMTTSTQGSKRSMVPIGMYERVMPLDILPTYLLRALIAGDTERAQELGALELDEEDLALCTFVCPGKYEYGPVLRHNLEEIEKNG